MFVKQSPSTFNSSEFSDSSSPFSLNRQKEVYVQDVLFCFSLILNEAGISSWLFAGKSFRRKHFGKHWECHLVLGFLGTGIASQVGRARDDTNPAPAHTEPFILKGWAPASRLRAEMGCQRRDEQEQSGEDPSQPFPTLSLCWYHLNSFWKTP